MPNPYHDAEGKFASRDEMKNAIEVAQKAGDFETYFRLRTDFEAAEKSGSDIFRDGPSAKPPLKAKEVEAGIKAYEEEQRKTKRHYEFPENIQYEKALDVPGLGRVQYIGEGGGGIGDTDKIIVYIKAGEHFYAISGYYSSQDGTDWGWASYYRVEPSVVSQTEYVYAGE